MNFLILNGPRSPRAAAYPHYRGTYRAHPTYSERLPEDSEINKLFFWFLEEGGELAVVHDLSKALRYAELLNDHPLPRRSHFEVVEVTDGDEPPHVGGELLGFDVSSGYNNSLLWWWQPATQPGAIASVERNGDTSPSATIFPEPIRALSTLIKRFYTPRLNRNGLFQTPVSASECLRDMDALQQLCPNLYEGESLKDNFCATGVYLVS